MRFAMVLLLAVLCAEISAQESYTHPAIDELLQALRGNGEDRNLRLIDSTLLVAGVDADPRLLYFLRRYRCEQLYYQGLLDESMVEAEKARRISLDLLDSALVASSLNQVAVLLEERRANEQGIALLQEALGWYPKKNPYTYPLATPHRIHGNLGLCWANLGGLDSARYHQQRSLDLAQLAQVPRGEALALLALGRIEQAQLTLDGALSLFDRSMAVADEHGIRDVQLDALAAKADALIEAGRKDEMLATLETGRAVMRAHGTIAPRSLSAFKEMEVRWLAKAGQYKEALAAAREWRAQERTLRSSSARTAQRILQELHETNAELERELDRAGITTAERAAEDRIRRVLTIGGTIILVLLVALVVVFIARSRQRSHLARLAVLQIEQERQIADLRVRQQVAEDLHDDLGAGLSALNLNSELAADLSGDPDEQMRARNLAGIAGSLIASMRHILWSLTRDDAPLNELVTYISDQARSHCDEKGGTVAIDDAGGWPAFSADAEVRHLAWPVVRTALDALLSCGTPYPLRIELAWKEGISIVVRAPGNTDPAVRSSLAEQMAAHHLPISRTGGWLRTATDGDAHAEIFLPCALPSNGNSRSGLQRKGAAALAVACMAISASVIAQPTSSFRHPLLDRILSTEAMSTPASQRLQDINSAIEEADTLNDKRVMCHLLMSRANQMYYRGLHDVGMLDADRALELAKTTNDSLLIATAINMIGLLNENLGDASVTLPWFRKAAKWLPRDTECAYPVVKDYHLDGNIAQCLLELGKNDSALYHFQRSLESAARNGNLRATALANLGLARAWQNKGWTSGINEFLDSAQAQALRCGSTDVYVDALPFHARHMLRTRGPDGAKRVLDEALLFIRSDSTINRSSIRRFFEQASPIREELGQYEEAYAAWSEWQALDSTIRTSDEEAALATLRIMLDNGEQLSRERAARERDQAQLIMDRSVRNALVSTIGITSLLLLVVFLLLLNRRRYKRSLEKMELERVQGRKELALLRIRQRISEDMLVELGAGLEALRLRSQLASQWQQEAGSRDRMGRIAAQAAALGTDLKQIAWALDTGRSSLAETLRFTAHYASTYCAQQGLMLHLRVSETIPELSLSMEQRRNIFLVVKEALHNVVKHARAREVSVSMSCSDELAVSIIDNGRGPAAAAARREGNGMRNMRKRIEAIDGTFGTADEGGMAIRFSVPLGDNNGSKQRRAI